MTNNTIYRKLEEPLTFHDPNGHPLTVQAVTLAFPVAVDNIEASCRLTVLVDYELYQQRIEPQELFNLAPERRGEMMFAEQFDEQLPLQIECLLKPEMTPQLFEQAQTVDEVISHLTQLPPNAPLLLTENWLALSVKQQHGGVKIGYRTNWVNGTTQATATEPNSSPPALNSKTAFSSADEDSLFATVQQFLVKDEWPFTQVADFVLNTGFAGENGQISCFVQVREEAQQFVFYSMCPVRIPEERRQVMAEFVSRANYGMLIGNFELDFDDGELRYKTSIDVDGDSLSLVLVRNIIYPNVMMMDRYLPGIMMVTYGDSTPAEAIQHIEG